MLPTTTARPLTGAAEMTPTTIPPKRLDEIASAERGSGHDATDAEILALVAAARENEMLREQLNDVIGPVRRSARYYGANATAPNARVEVAK